MPNTADEAQDQEPATPASVTSSDGGIFCPSLSHKFARRAEAVCLRHFGLSLSLVPCHNMFMQAIGPARSELVTCRCRSVDSGECKADHL